MDIIDLNVNSFIKIQLFKRCGYTVAVGDVLFAKSEKVFALMGQDTVCKTAPAMAK